MSDLWAVARDQSPVAPEVAATLARFSADYVDPRGATEPVCGALVGAVFAAILPIMGETAAPEFAAALETAARERFVEPVSLLWEPIEEILNIIRPGHVWQFDNGSGAVVYVPAQVVRDAGAPSPAAR